MNNLPVEGKFDFLAKGLAAATLVVMVAVRDTEPPRVEGLRLLVTAVAVASLGPTVCVKTGDVLLV